MSLQGATTKVQFKATLESLLANLANALKIVKAVQTLPSGARFRYENGRMVGRRDAESMYNASLSIMKSYVLKSYTAAGKAKRKVSAKGTSLGFTIPFSVGTELKNYINTVYSGANYKPIRDVLHYFNDDRLNQEIANQNLLTNLLVIVVKIEALPQYSLHNQNRPLDQWNKQWLGANQPMLTGLQNTFNTLITESNSEEAQKKRADKVAKFRAELQEKLNATVSITDATKRAAAGQKLNASYATKIRDASQSFNPSDFRYSGIQSIISKNRTALSQGAVVTNEQLKQLHEVIMPSSLTKKQKESREQDLIEGVSKPTILINQAFSQAGRQPSPQEAVVALLSDDLYFLKNSIQSLKAQEVGMDISAYRAKIREKIAKITS